MPRYREGPVRNKKTGHYYFNGAIGFGADKKRVRQSLRTRDPEKALYLWEREFKRQWDIYYGIRPALRPKQTSFIEAGRTFIAYERDIKRIKEWPLFRQRLNRVLDIISDIDIQKFGSAEITKIDAGLKQAGRSEATVNHYFNLLRTFFYFCIRKGLYAGRNPVLDIRPYAVSAKRREYSTDELGRIVEAAGQIEARAQSRVSLERCGKRLVLLLLLTGMRLGEALGLRWESIKEDKIIFGQAETKQRREKIIPITVGLRAALDSLWADRRKDGFVLPLHRKARARIVYPDYLIKKIRHLSGVADFTFHGLRHTAATIMIAESLGRGVGLPDIMRILGHARPETTMRYAHEDFERMRRAMAALENAVKK